MRRLWCYFALWNVSFKIICIYFPSVIYQTFRFSSVTQSCPTLCYPMDYSTVSLPCPSPAPGAYSNSCPSSWWCHPTSHPLLLSPCPLLFPPSIFPSISVFSIESALHIKRPKCWCFSFQSGFIQILVKGNWVRSALKMVLTWNPQLKIHWKPMLHGEKKKKKFHRIPRASLNAH